MHSRNCQVTKIDCCREARVSDVSSYIATRTDIKGQVIGDACRERITLYTWGPNVGPRLRISVGLGIFCSTRYNTTRVTAIRSRGAYKPRRAAWKPAIERHRSDLAIVRRPLCRRVFTYKLPGFWHFAGIVEASAVQPAVCTYTLRARCRQSP